MKKWTCLNVIWINLKGDNRVLETQGDQEIYKNNECAVKIIKNALEKEPWMLFYVGALLGGLRQSELNKLRWSDINYDDNSISIKQANRASIKITMPNWYMDELKLHQVTRKTDIYLVHADHGLRISEV